jgi:hypothetical protein
MCYAVQVNPLHPPPAALSQQLWSDSFSSLLWFVEECIFIYSRVSRDGWDAPNVRWHQGQGTEGTLSKNHHLSGQLRCQIRAKRTRVRAYLRRVHAHQQFVFIQVFVIRFLFSWRFITQSSIKCSFSKLAKFGGHWNTLGSPPTTWIVSENKLHMHVYCYLLRGPNLSSIQDRFLPALYWQLPVNSRLTLSGYLRATQWLLITASLRLVLRMPRPLVNFNATWSRAASFIRFPGRGRYPFFLDWYSRLIFSSMTPRLYFPLPSAVPVSKELMICQMAMFMTRHSTSFELFQMAIAARWKL